MPPQEASRSIATRRRRTAHNARQGFMRLPGELRNYIWELAIPSDVKFDTSKLISFEQSNTNRREAAKQYALECRRLRDEQRNNYRHNIRSTKIFQKASNDRASLYAADVEFILTSRYPSRWTPITPAITQICTKLRDETLRFFYSSNIFELDTRSVVEYEIIQRWLGSRPLVGLKAMRQAQICYREDESSVCVLQLLLDFSLGVASSVGSSSSPGQLPQKPNTISTSSVCVSEATPDDWLAMSVASWDVFDRLKISVPAMALAQRKEEVKHLHGSSGGEKDKTREQLMEIVKAFNSYKKSSFENPKTSIENSKTSIVRSSEISSKAALVIGLDASCATSDTSPFGILENQQDLDSRDEHLLNLHNITRIAFAVKDKLGRRPPKLKSLLTPPRPDSVREFK